MKRRDPGKKGKNIMTLPTDTLTSSTAETEALGGQLAVLLRDNSRLPRFVALYGDLGVGKTAFVRGFTAALTPDAHVKSPTFALVHEYPAVPDPVFHFDMYRVTDDDELYSAGFYDYESRGGICLAEWCEKIPWALPEKYIRVSIMRTEIEGERSITIELIEQKG